MAVSNKQATAATPSAPTATVGGSTALWAALTPQAGTTALTLTAVSVTAGATLQWTAYGPTDTDETAQIITAGDTTATPTWAAFSGASGVVGGGWKIRLDVTLSGLTTTYTRTVQIGAVLADVPMVEVHNVYWPDEATVDLLSAGSGSYDGVTYTVPATNWTSVDVTNGVGLVTVSAAGGDAKVTRPRQCSAVDSLHCVMVALDHPGGANKFVQVCGFTSASTTALVAPNLGHNGSAWILRWYDKITGSAAYTDFAIGATKPTVVAVVYDGSYHVREIRYSTAAFTGTWPAWSAMTVIRPPSRTSDGFQTSAPVLRSTASEVCVIGTDEDRPAYQQASMTVTWLGTRVLEAM